MSSITQVMIAWVSSTILLLGYPGIIFLMTLESIILPLPSEVILPFAGHLAARGELNFWLVVLSATIGSLLGSAVSYAIGRYGGRPFLMEHGKYFLIKKEHIERSERWFKRYGERAVFLCRLLPVVRYFISIPAGITKMRPRKFFVYTFAGALIWNLALTYIGFAFAERWDRMLDYTATFEAIVVLLVLAVILWYIVKAIDKRTTMLERVSENKTVQRNIRAVRRNVKSIGDFSKTQANRMMQRKKRPKV